MELPKPAVGAIPQAQRANRHEAKKRGNRPLDHDGRTHEDPEPEPASLRRCPAKLHRKIDSHQRHLLSKAQRHQNCIGFGQMSLGKGKQTGPKSSGGKQSPRFSVKVRGQMIGSPDHRQKGQ